MDNGFFPPITEKEIALFAAENYPFEGEITVSLLKYSENLTYLLEYGNKEKAVLRIARKNYHSREEILSEMKWIEEIRRSTDILTAGVIHGRDGGLIYDLNCGGGSLVCCAFEFLNGQTLRGIDGEALYEIMEKIGGITAKLHIQSQTMNKEAFTRFGWDFEDLIGEKSRWGDFKLMKGLPAEYISLYSAAAELAKKRLELYGKSPSRFGLIHSDLNINNILSDSGKLYVLDFDDCGFGWFLYDFSTTVLEFFDEKLKKCVDALLKGYEKFRPLPEEDKQELFTFIVLRKIVRIGWIATHSDNDTVKKVEPDYYKKTAELSEKYVGLYTV